MKHIALKGAVACAVLMASYSCDEVVDALSENNETARGLKSALSVGIETAAKKLGARGGYLNDDNVRINMPVEAVTAFNAVQTLSKNETFSKILEATDSSIPDEKTFIELFNTSAEEAAPQSVGIFKTAITDMTIDDAETILFGEDDAATTYLRSNTYTGLQSSFHKPVTNCLNSVKVAGVTTTKAWSTFSTYNNKLANLKSKTAVQAGLALAKKSGVIDEKQYNSIDKIQVVDEDLSDYITGEALTGLFTKVADQELQIRTNVDARVNDVLKKVFGRLDTEKRG